MNDKTNSPLYLVCAYFIIAAGAFALSPILALILYVLGFLLAVVGYTIDIILGLLLCLVGYDESIGDAILHSLEGPEPLTAWIVFMVPFTLFLIHIFIVSCKSNDIEPIAIHHIPENLMRKIGKVNGNTVAKEFCPTTKDIDADYRNGQISREEANSRIKKRFKSWIMEKCDIDAKEAEYVWKSKKWLIEYK